MFYTSKKNWDKILGYAEEAYKEHKSEIGGMSVMIEDKEGDWNLEDPVILEQEISSGNTILDKDALAVYYTKQASKMKKQNFRFCWWHSHHTMSAFWSSTDVKAIDEFNEGDFSFALVVNLKGEYKFRVSVWKPFEVHEDVELQVLRPSRINKHIRRDVKKYCTKEISTWKKHTYDGITTYGNYTYKSADQRLKDAAEDPRQERLPFRTTTGQTALSGKQTFTEIVEAIDDMNSDAIDGTDTYIEYKIRVDELNKILKNENNMYSVDLIPENKLGDLLHMWPNQMVIYDTTREQVDYIQDEWGGWGV